MVVGELYAKNSNVFHISLIESLFQNECLNILLKVVCEFENGFPLADTVIKHRKSIFSNRELELYFVVLCKWIK